MALCSQIHTRHIKTVCGQNVEFVKVKPGGTYSDHWDIRGLTQLPDGATNLKGQLLLFLDWLILNLERQTAVSSGVSKSVALQSVPNPRTLKWSRPTLTYKNMAY